jgi:ADP-ribosyl-[dinitrogen reductase] hydrolase
LTLTREDRIAGCLLGGALGDAVGAHFEGLSASDDFAFPSDPRVTDDTQLTIATCESIVESCTVTPEAVAKHFTRWFRDRRITGIGSSTLKAFTELEAGGHWALVGATGERSAGNGAAMRVAPLAFFLDPDIDSQRRTIRDICWITHRNDEAYIGALALLRTIRYMIAGDVPFDNIPLLLLDVLPDSRVRDRLAESHGHSIAEYASRFATTGYVVDSVPLAILAATQSTDVLDSIQKLVRCGGDTDSIASMFGQIFGAAHGVIALPADKLNQIDAVSLVRETAANLSRTSITI